MSTFDEVRVLLPARVRLGRWLIAALVLVTVGGLLAVAAVAAGRLLGGPRAPTVPSSPAVEQTWGVHVTAVNVTADGGLIDLRLVVLDATKAAALMADRQVAPRIVVEDSGRLTLFPAMTVHRRMQVGRTYFLLYRNTGGVVRAGHELTIAVGRLRINGVVPG